MNNTARRFKEFRALYGLTQTDLSKAIGYSQPTVSLIEQGLAQPAADLLHRIETSFGVDSEFFARNSHAYSRGELNFRTKKLPAPVHDAIAVAFGERENYVLNMLAASGIQPLPISISRNPHQLTQEEIDSAADNTRETLGIPRNEPITNVTRALERAGIVVDSLDTPAFDLEEYGVEAVSSPINDERGALVASVKTESGDRVRFSRAHEAGHLVLHRIVRPQSEVVRESEANAFAGSFLFPTTAARSLMSSNMTLVDFAKIKSRWGVSIQALVYRAKETEIITYERFRSLMIQISSRGWKKKEPVPVGIEEPALIDMLNTNSIPQKTSKPVLRVIS